MISEFSDNGIMSTLGLRRRECCVPCSDENRTLNVARRYRKIVYHTRSRHSKRSVGVLTVYPKPIRPQVRRGG